MREGSPSFFQRLLSALAIGALGFWLGQRFGQAPLPPAEPQYTVADTATLLRAVQHLARLETVSYHMEQVVDLKDTQSRLFGLVEAEDAILLVAAGDVVAGIDLGREGAVDLQADAETRHAVLSLPAPEVFSASLDNERTYVQRRSTDLLAKRGGAIETRARQHAEREISRLALKAGILEEAQQSATQTLQALLQSFGYRDVEIRFRPAER